MGSAILLYYGIPLKKIIAIITIIITIIIILLLLLLLLLIMIITAAAVVVVVIVVVIRFCKILLIVVLIHSHLPAKGKTVVNFQNVNRLDKLIQKLWECRLSPKTPTVRTAYIIICLTFFSRLLTHFCYECPCRSSNAINSPDPRAVTLPG